MTERLKIPIRYLFGNAPENTYIPATLVSQYFHASTLVELAQEEINDIRQQAAEIIKTAEHEALFIRTEARQQGIENAEIELATLRSDIIYQTVEWLVDEEELEIDLASQMESKLRKLLAQSLDEYIGEQDNIDILMQRVQKRIPDLWRDEPITLRIAPEAMDAAKNLITEAIPLRIVTDPSYQPTQALLETRLAVIDIDIALHLVDILSRLKYTNSTCEPKLASDHNK